VRASYGMTIVAETDRPVIYECRPYFPLASEDLTRLEPSNRHTICPWTGRADYFTVITEDGERIQKGAWTYRRVIPGARRIRHHVAFWRGVTFARADEGERCGQRACAHPRPSKDVLMD